MLNKLKKIVRNYKKDILRLSLRSAVAAVITYAVISYVRPDEAFLAVLSAILILDFHIGSAINAAKNRLMATLLGCVLGLITVWLLPDGWGTSVALALSMFILNAIAAVKGEWRYGVVAAISIALGAESNAFEISADRLIAIGIGAGVGVLVSFLILPQKAEVRAANYLRKAIKSMSERFTIVIHNTRSEEGKSTKVVRRNFYSNLGSARQCANQIKYYDATNIRNSIDALEKVHNSVVMVDRIAAKTKTEISGKMSGIRNNVDKFMKIVTDILEKISKSEFENQSEFNKLEAIISDIQNDIKFSDNNQRILNMQHSFIFAIDEIKENLKITNDYFKKA